MGCRVIGHAVRAVVYLGDRVLVDTCLFKCDLAEDCRRSVLRCGRRRILRHRSTLCHGCQVEGEAVCLAPVVKILCYLQRCLRFSGGVRDLYFVIAAVIGHCRHQFTVNIFNIDISIMLCFVVNDSRNFLRRFLRYHFTDHVAVCAHCVKGYLIKYHRGIRNSRRAFQHCHPFRHRRAGVRSYPESKLGVRVIRPIPIITGNLLCGLQRSRGTDVILVGESKGELLAGGNYTPFPPVFGHPCLFDLRFPVVSRTGILYFDINVIVRCIISDIIRRIAWFNLFNTIEIMNCLILILDRVEMKISKLSCRIIFRQYDRLIFGKRSSFRQRCHLNRVTRSGRPDTAGKYLICRKAFLGADQLPAIVAVAVSLSGGLDLFRNKPARKLSARLLYEGIRRDQMPKEVSGRQIDLLSIRNIPYICRSFSGITGSGSRSVDRDYGHINLTAIRDVDQCVDRRSNIADDVDLFDASERFDRDLLTGGDREYFSVIAYRRASRRALFEQHLRFLPDDVVELIPVNIVI